MTAIIDLDTPKPLADDVLRAMATTCSTLAAQKRAESLEILHLMRSYIAAGGVVTVVHPGASGIVIAPPEPAKKTKEQNRAEIAARDWENKTRADRLAAARKAGAKKRKKG